MSHFKIRFMMEFSTSETHHSRITVRSAGGVESSHKEESYGRHNAPAAARGRANNSLMWCDPDMREDHMVKAPRGRRHAFPEARLGAHGQHQ